MKTLWQQIKQEFIKTFVRGDEIPSGSGFITWRTHDPSRIEMWWSRTKHQIKENATVIQTVATVIGILVGVVGVLVAIFK